MHFKPFCFQTSQTQRVVSEVTLSEEREKQNKNVSLNAHSPIQNVYILYYFHKNNAF